MKKYADEIVIACWILAGSALVFTLAMLSGCGKAGADGGVQIAPVTAQDGSQCLVLFQNGEARGLSCR